MSFITRIPSGEDLAPGRPSDVLPVTTRLGSKRSTDFPWSSADWLSLVEKGMCF